MNNKFTAHDVKLQLAYYCRFKRQSLMMADEVTFGDFVADFAAIISWRLYEFEIKMSIQDLKNDFFKSRLRAGLINKHDIINAGKGPHYFYFVVPYEIKKQAEEIIPQRLGLMSVRNTSHKDCSSIYVWRRSKLLRKSGITNRKVEAIFKRQQSLIYNYYKMLGGEIYNEFPEV